MAVVALALPQFIVRRILPTQAVTQSVFVTCTTTTASLAEATVQTAVNNAADGDVVCLPAGSATWSSTLSFDLTKGVTIAGQDIVTGGSGTSTLLGSTDKFTFPTGSSTKRYRIGGIHITQSGGQGVVWTCNSGGCVGTISQFRFDHNVVNNSGAVSLLTLGENGSKQYIYGVVDHNTVSSSGSLIEIYWLGATDNSPPSPPLGTSNNIFVEDNTFTMTSITDLGTGCTDGWGGMAMVYRHNTSTNCRIITHGVTHGGGPANIEVYNNTIKENAGSDSANSGIGAGNCYRCLHHQGSNTYLAFNNTLDSTGSSLGHDSDPAAFLHYRDYWFSSNGPGTAGYSLDSGILPCDGTFASDGNRAPATTWRGYPCWRQPGRDVSGAFKPMYFWNNVWNNGAIVSMAFDSQGGTPPPSCTASSGGTCEYDTIHILANREWYQAVSVNAQTSPTSPFNGTTGMGFGTLANRPTTCTTATEAGAGVGYFATDDGTQGTLYTCSSTNTWSVYYRPYTYPFPWP